MAAISQPNSNAPAGSMSPTGAIRITPPQPLLWFRGFVGVPISPPQSAIRQVVPGPRLECSARTCVSRPSGFPPFQLSTQYEEDRSPCVCSHRT